MSEISFTLTSRSILISTNDIYDLSLKNKNISGFIFIIKYSIT